MTLGEGGAAPPKQNSHHIENSKNHHMNCEITFGPTVHEAWHREAAMLAGWWRHSCTDVTLIHSHCINRESSTIWKKENNPIFLLTEVT